MKEDHKQGQDIEGLISAFLERHENKIGFSGYKVVKASQRTGRKVQTLRKNSSLATSSPSHPPTGEKYDSV